MRVWNFLGGDCAATLRGHKGTVFGASFSTDGSLFVTASGGVRDGKASGPLRLRLPGLRVVMLLLSHHGHGAAFTL